MAVIGEGGAAGAKAGHGEVSKSERTSINKHRPCLIWITGLSGAGKTTVSTALDRRLFDMGIHTYMLDGDLLRDGLNSDLGFSETDRVENIRRVGEVSRLFVDAGLIVISAFISPFRADRDKVRKLLPDGEFLEVHMSTPLNVCEQRDPKGLYKKARAGTIPQFTGISSPYEPPLHPELVLDGSGAMSVDACVDRLISLLRAREFIS
jgi:adenylyl-sulfate kinase